VVRELSLLREGEVTSGVPLPRDDEPQYIEGGATAELRRMFAPGAGAVTQVDLLAPDCVAVLPLLGRHRPVGILSACSTAGRGRFSQVDLELLRDVAAHGRGPPRPHPQRRWRRPRP
jgi:hypothetical protein